MMIGYVHPELSPSPLYYLTQDEAEGLVATANLQSIVDGPMTHATARKLFATLNAVITDMQTVENCGGNMLEAEKKIIRFAKMASPIKREVMEEVEV